VDSGRGDEILAQFGAFCEHTTDFVGVSDPWGRILYLNPAAKKRLGVDDVTGLTLADLFPLETFSFYYDVVRPELLRTGSWSGEVLVNAAGAGAIPMYVSTTATLGPGGETNGGVMYAHELPKVDVRAGAGEGDVDEDTGVLRRAAFEGRVRVALEGARRDGDGCAFVLAEIAHANDAMQDVDTLTAAHIIRALAGRMTRLARSIDIVGRVGERQLGLLLRSVRNHSEALRIAHMVHEGLVDPPVTTAGGEMVVSVVCGVAYSEADDDPGALIERASTTMTLEAKPRARDVETARYGSDPSETSVTMDEFRVAMSHGRIRPYAQPVVDLGSDTIAGYRGFARWHHSNLGVLEPTAFVDMIADSTLANEVDLYVARETAAVLLLTSADVLAHLYAPASRRLIADLRTEQYLSEIAAAFFLRMAQIHLQIARPLLEGWTPVLDDALRSLREADVALAITGVDNAADAHDLVDDRFQELQLSRRLVRAAPGDTAARRTVADIVRRAHDRGLRVTATGVDDAGLRDAMIESGCDRATGDLYGRPVPANTIEDVGRPVA
jgi:EAL domain-containing protein (putative c-di-GMP-specific phosphodiesterase class I)/GGDEF domain-containing protein